MSLPRNSDAQKILLNYYAKKNTKNNQHISKPSLKPIFDRSLGDSHVSVVFIKQFYFQINKIKR